MTNIDMTEEELNKFLGYCRECVKQTEHVTGSSTNEFLTDVKTVVFAGLVSYYGPDKFNDIYMAFLKTKFVVCDETISQLLMDKYNFDEKSVLKFSEHCPGVFYNAVAFKNQKSNKYQIKRTVYVSKFMASSSVLIHSLIHQMNHILNSINNSIVNKRNIGLGSRMGIAFDSFISRSCDSLGLEEAFNKLQSEEVMDRIIEFSFYNITISGVSNILNSIFHGVLFDENREDDLITKIARPLYKDDEFNKVLVDRRFTGRLAGIREEFDSKVGEGSYAEFLSICDKLSNPSDDVTKDSDDAKLLVKKYLDKSNNN